MIRFGESDHPFYRPLWRRVAIVAVLTAWFGYEVFVSGDGMWMVLTGAALAYSAWTFLIAFKPKDPEA